MWMRLTFLSSCGGMTVTPLFVHCMTMSDWKCRNVITYIWAIDYNSIARSVTYQAVSTPVSTMRNTIAARAGVTHEVGGHVVV